MSSARLAVGLSAALVALVSLGCTRSADEADTRDDADAGTNDDAAGDAALDAQAEDALLAEARQKFPNVAALVGAIQTTCGPNNGVCHNNRQYPDLTRYGGFLETIGAPCNIDRPTPGTIDNLCEELGDELHLGTFTAHVGNVTAVPPDAPTVYRLKLDTALPFDATTMAGQASLACARPGLATATVAIPADAIVAGAQGASSIDLQVSAISGEDTSPDPALGVRSLADFLLPTHPFSSAGTSQIRLGDPNADGVYGASLGGALIVPGAPERSYLFLRVVDALAGGTQSTNLGAAASSHESQMPIANFQYWDVDPAVTAIYCWIRQLAPDASNREAPIDYGACDVSAMPPIHHQGTEATTFSKIYAELLGPSCAAGCHFQGTSQPTTLYLDTPETAYATLLGLTGKGPSELSGSVPYVVPTDPEGSYLYRKLSGQGRHEGDVMPPGAKLTDDSIQAVGRWITQGAKDN